MDYQIYIAKPVESKGQELNTIFCFLHNGGSKRRKTYRPCKLVIDVNQSGIEPVRALFSKCLAFPEVKLSVMDYDFGLLFYYK